MTTIENSTSATTAPAKTAWVRRTVMGTAVAVVAMLTLGTHTTPAQAYWYNGYWYPNYAYQPYPAYYPYGYGYYNPGYYHVGWGWRGGWGGWRGGWGGGWHHHW
jgi:hypothetical protein